MGFIALPELVAAVSNAGGLGLLGVGPAPAPVMQQMIQQVKKLTARPFGVDFVHENTSFGPATTDAHIDCCIAEGVKLVVFFWNSPPKTWMKRLQESGARVWYQGSTIAKAREAIEMGVSAIIAQGSEAGGHNKSDTGLFALLPAMKDSLPDVPVIAAGGIADGRGVAAALALGADGVCVGTRLLASREANIHREYQARVVAAECEDVARTCIFGPEWPDQPMPCPRWRCADVPQHHSSSLVRCHRRTWSSIIRLRQAIEQTGVGGSMDESSTRQGLVR